jgi:hypothetical protein
MKVQKLRRPKKEKRKKIASRSPLLVRVFYLMLMLLEMSPAGVVNSILLKDTHSLTFILILPVWKYKNTEALAKMEFLMPVLMVPRAVSFETHTHSNKYIARPGTIRSLFLWTIVLVVVRRGEPTAAATLGFIASLAAAQIILIILMTFAPADAVCVCVYNVCLCCAPNGLSSTVETKQCDTENYWLPPYRSLSIYCWRGCDDDCARCLRFAGAIFKVCSSLDIVIWRATGISRCCMRLSCYGFVLTHCFLENFPAATHLVVQKQLATFEN